MRTSAVVTDASWSMRRAVHSLQPLVVAVSSLLHCILWIVYRVPQVVDTRRNGKVTQRLLTHQVWLRVWTGRGV